MNEEKHNDELVPYGMNLTEQRNIANIGTHVKVHPLCQRNYKLRIESFIRKNQKVPNKACYRGGSALLRRPFRTGTASYDTCNFSAKSTSRSLQFKKTVAS